MHNERPRLILDMDEVIADVQPKLLDLYAAEFGTRITVEDYWGQKIYDLPQARHFRQHLFATGFFRDLPVMPHSQEVVQELADRFDVYIVTAAMEFPHSFKDKYDWLSQYFSFIPWKNWVFCGSKRAICGDYMIDDHARNLQHFAGTGLLYHAQHNVAEDRFERVHDWLAIRDYFRANG